MTTTENISNINLKTFRRTNYINIKVNEQKKIQLFNKYYYNYYYYYINLFIHLYFYVYIYTVYRRY